MRARRITTIQKGNYSQGFPPICSGGDRILVLGSFPGKASLQKQEYYGHPHNGFWRIMGALLGFDPQLSYPERVSILNRKRVALWDVLTSCSRKGSLDSSILKDSMVLNDFENFFEKNDLIHTILFNGALAEAQFKRQVTKLDTTTNRTFEFHRLPSTSPAMAMLNLSEKIEAWSILVEKLKIRPHN
jgi:hypoxanthine-DNA glycosylase